MYFYKVTYIWLLWYKADLSRNEEKMYEKSSIYLENRTHEYAAFAIQSTFWGILKHNEFLELLTRFHCFSQ